MVNKIPSLERLVEQLSRLPGVGEKTALRLSFDLLQDQLMSNELSEALVAAKENIRLCHACFTYIEEDVCYYCNDANRTESVLCVVEMPSDIHRIERSGAFRGKYHVLHGALAPLNGVSAKDIKIDALMARVAHDPPQEIIFALDADIEGDQTVLYITKLLKDSSVKLSRIAHGVPIGGNIDYIDHRTLGKALENRIAL